MASGVVQALKSRNLGGKAYVSGLDADPANLKLVKDGLQTMTVWTELDVWGTEAIKAAVALAKGDKPKADADRQGVPTKLIPIDPVNKDNLCDFVEKAPKAWVTVKKVYGSSTC
jgi:D-xylose transport system substrate-binding protein